MTDPLFDTFSIYSRERLAELGFSNEQVVFLAQVGLPKWCAPNMNFGEVFELGELLPILEIETRRYVGIGEDRDGNTVAVDLDQHAVWALVKDSSPRFVTSSVLVLSTSLHKFQACVNAAVENDSRSFIENRIRPEYFEPFIQWVYSIDPLILERDSFWSNVLRWLGVPNNLFKADGYTAV